MGNPRPQQYWTLEKLQEVHAILRRISTPDVGTGFRSISESGSLADRVYNLYREKHAEVTKLQVRKALTLFGKMEILDPGKSGSKKDGFRRILNPKKVLTPTTVKRGFAKMGITWRPPSS